MRQINWKDTFSLPNFSTLDKRLERNRRRFEGQLKVLKFLGTGEVFAVFAQRAATFASYRHTGLFASEQLEEFLSKASQRVFGGSLRANLSCEPNSTLHILSRAYETGGHTRVVERWIQSSAESQKHSVLITRGGPPTLKLTAEVIKHNGEIHRLPRLMSFWRRAKLLREIAGNYSKVVLHTHMDDILPMLAFGESTTDRSILFFNHADHRFWIGTRVANSYLEMRKWGQNLSRNQRGIKSSKVVGIPIPRQIQKHDLLTKAEARRRLGLAPEFEILISVGSSQKFISGPRTDFPEFMTDVLTGFPNRLLVCIGPKRRSNPSWRHLESKFPGQVLVLPTVSHDRLMEFFVAADLGLDSFPMSGATAAVDMLSAGLPVIFLDCETGHLDVFRDSIFFARTKEEWVRKIADMLLPRKDRTIEVTRLLDSLEHFGSKHFWCGLREIDSNVPKESAQDAVGIDCLALDRYLVAATPRRAKLLI